VLLSHTLVAECAVAGLAHPYWGEAVTAFVVARPGASPDAAELAAFCRARLSGYKVPKEFRLVDALPRNSMGKILRRTLRSGPSG
ncbi:MAG: AMP-binding enzyme, partial [Acetobacteraceae bacterium]